MGRVHLSTSELVDNSNVLISQYGISRKPLDFVQRAMNCGHPRTLAIDTSSGDGYRSWRTTNMASYPADLAFKR